MRRKDELTRRRVFLKLLLFFCLDAIRAPQLKAIVRLSALPQKSKDRCFACFVDFVDRSRAAQKKTDPRNTEHTNTKRAQSRRYQLEFNPEQSQTE
jgi:hypothetical protein